MSKQGVGKDDIRNMVREALAEVFGVAVGDAAFGGVFATGSSTAAAISVILDTGGRPFFEVWVSSSGAGTFTVAGSVDGVAYDDEWTIVLAGPGSDYDGGFNAYRYIRVTNPALFDHEVRIVAAR